MKNRITHRVNWDSYQNGSYFVTVCTKNKVHYFGKIINEKMIYNDLGYKLKEIIENTILLRNDQYIEIPIFTIMPNHFHMIITINSEEDRHQHHFGSQSKNLSSIIRGIKSALTYYARCNNIPFNWHPRFYEHIIRNQKSFEQIYEYIEYNVINWDKDDFY